MKTWGYGLRTRLTICIIELVVWIRVTVLSYIQLTTRLNQSIPKMLPVMTEKLQQLHVRQRRLQELKPKIEEVSLTSACFIQSCTCTCIYMYVHNVISVILTKCMYQGSLYILLHNSSWNVESEEIIWHGDEATTR